MYVEIDGMPNSIPLAVYFGLNTAKRRGWLKKTKKSKVAAGKLLKTWWIHVFSFVCMCVCVWGG